MRIEHHAVADDAFAAGAQHAAGNELEHELLAADDDGVAGVMAAGVARHGGEPLAEHVHNFALALVAPLGAQHYRRLCSHVFGFPFDWPGAAPGGFPARGRRLDCGVSGRATSKMINPGVGRFARKNRSWQCRSKSRIPG